MPSARLDRTSTMLTVIDVQEKFMAVIDRREMVEENIVRLIRGAQVVGCPTLVTEQYVKGIGRTVEPIRKALDETTGYYPIEKMCFSAHGCADFASALRAQRRRQVLVAGVETHVCVYQTVMDLLRDGFEVTIIADAISSRTSQNREIALERMVSEGARLASTEMVLFELLDASGTDEFRAISKLVK
jgi:nicotinamidase-related amidase